MARATEQDFGLAASREELALRRRLLFRLLRDFDFAVPEFHGEMITPPTRPDQRGQDWVPPHAA